MADDHLGIGIIAQTPGDSKTNSGHIAVPMILNILLQFHDEIHLFTRATAVMEFDHPDIHVHKYSKPFADSAWYLRLPGQIIYQLKYSLGLFLYRDQIDLVIFRGSGFIFPVLTSKVLGMCILSRVGGVKYRQERSNSESQIEYYWSRFLEELEITLHQLTDVVILTTPHVAEFAGIEQFQSKTYVWCHYFFDLTQFSVETPYEQRGLTVGQVAIISETKGSLNFIESMAAVNKSSDVKVLLVGGGPLEAEAKQRCDELGLDAEFIGRIPRDEVPSQLNRMRLNVLSSVSEGLPKAAIEAMACGTPVVATEVGGLPDVISHGETGFLAASNDPDELEKVITDALTNYDLEQISGDARQYVEENYSFESAVAGYHDLVTEATPYTLPDLPETMEQPIEVP
jgi:glycosyltransferase involved in cell wall biosynthesis